MAQQDPFARYRQQASPQNGDDDPFAKYRVAPAPTPTTAPKIGRGQFFGESPKATLDANVGAMVGGPLGGAIGGALMGGPIGAIGGGILGAGLLGTAGAAAGGQPLGEAMQAGAGEALWETLGPVTGGMAGLMRKGGKNLVQHAFGPQAAVVKEFGEDITGDALEALTNLKLERTGIFQPVGGRRAIREIQGQIDEAIEGRKAVLAGPAGDRPASPMAALLATVTPEGETVHPLRDLYRRTQKTTNPLSDLAAIRGEARDFMRHPTLTERVAKEVESPLPPELQSSMGRMSPEAEAAVRAQLGLTGPKTQWVQQMRSSVPARELQEIVSGTYKKIDKAGGYMNDPSIAPKRDAMKAQARGLKEEYTRIVPEAIPYNKEMEQLIPLREALVNAEAGLQSDPLVRLGETFALSSARPGMAIGSLLNRPKVESILGQSMYTAGNAGRTAAPAVNPLIRLARMLADGDPTIEKASFTVRR